MIRLVILSLIWLSNVRSEMQEMQEMQMHMPEEMMMMMPEKMEMPESGMMKPKRDSFHNPCPPVYAHASYSPPPIYVKPYMPPVYPKKEITVHAAPIQYVHQPSVTYVKPPPPPPVIVKPAYMPVVQSKVVYPVYQKPEPVQVPVYQKPAPVHLPVYHKPIYYGPQMYYKQMYDMPKVYVKKYEAPEVMYQKPAEIHYQPEKVVHVQQPQISYVKIAQPMVHPPVYHPPPMVKPHCP